LQLSVLLAANVSASIAASVELVLGPDQFMETRVNTWEKFERILEFSPPLTIAMFISVLIYNFN